jgi:hypothetical protein
MKQEKETFTRTITTKVTESEWKQLDQLCSQSGVSRSELCRKALLTQLNFTNPNSSPSTPTETTLLLAEVLAFRTIVVNLLHSIGSGESLSRDQVRSLTELADREKLRRAIERLQQLGSLGSK